MAGHSHWAGIKHKKALVDNKRGKLWSRLSKNIIVAAKSGGGDPATNLKLRYAIDDAKKLSMPKDNIERAIKRGTGEIAGGDLEGVVYEGYGPGGVAILCEVLTDKRTRTAPEIRNLFERHGGNLGSTGCVAYLFETKGMILLSQDQIQEDALLELIIEAGGDDFKKVEDNYEILCSTEDFSGVRDALEEHGLNLEMAELTRIPSTTVELDAEVGRQVLALMEKLDDHDDVQNVYANFSISDEAMAEIGGQ